MPTRKALRHSRRRNTDLRVFYFFITYTITSSLICQINLLTYFLRDWITGVVPSAWRLKHVPAWFKQGPCRNDARHSSRLYALSRRPVV